MRCNGFIGMLLFGFAAAVGAQSTNNAVRSLSLQQCIDLALEHNLELQIERYSPEIARFTLSGSYAAYDPIFNFRASKAYVDKPGAFDPWKNNPDFPYQEDIDTFGPGLSGRLPSGLTYDAKAAFDYRDARTDFNSAPTTAAAFPGGIRSTNDYFASAGITLSQPLLKNAWIDADRQRISVNKKTLQMSETALRRRVMEIATQVQVTYYELIFFREKIRLEQAALGLAQELVSETRKKVEVGELAPLEVKQAEAQAGMIESGLLTIEEAYEAQQNALKALISDDVHGWMDATIDPTENLSAVVELYDKYDSWDRAMKQRPDLLEARLDLERHDIHLRYTWNQRLPSLNLEGSYGGSAVARTLGFASGDIGDRDHPSFSYGAILSFPLGNREARNVHKASQASKKQALLRLQKLEHDIFFQVDSSIKAAESALKRVSATRNARITSEAALEGETQKLQAGNTTRFVVLQLQRDMTAARTAEVRALADYNKARAQLAFNEGSTLEKHRIDIIAK